MASNTESNGRDNKEIGMISIIGAGPAGLFAAHTLSDAGIKCQIFDMGKRIEDRECPATEECDCPTCDVLEGVGGAGGLSDGKNTYSLSRGTQLETIFDPEHEWILNHIDDLMTRYSSIYGPLVKETQEFPQALEKTQFSFSNYTLRHMGSDGIREFIKNLSEDLTKRGVQIHTGVEIVSVTPSIRSDPRKYYIYTKEREVIESNPIIVATGLQGAPWWEREVGVMGIPMRSGPAGFGIRFESDADVLAPLFDLFYDFKLTYEYAGMTFRSFCCNRNGFVLNENHRTLGVRNVNGHSFFRGPKSDRSNLAIIAKISTPGAQQAVRDTAARINSVFDSTVAQTVPDFLSRKPTSVDTPHIGTNRQAVTGVDIGGFLPDDLYRGFATFIREMSKVCPDRLLTEKSIIYAPEIKYYGMKIPVDFSTWEMLPGLYVIGNATGYLDSFVSAALTGVIAAKNIIKSKKEN
jgi:uncharacterized protein